MDAKRMLNISEILTALFFFPPSYVYLQRVFVRGGAQMISDSSRSEKGCIHSHLPGKTQNGNKCVGACVRWLMVERAERRHRLDEIKASQRINYRQNIKHGQQQ